MKPLTPFQRMVKQYAARNERVRRYARRGIPAAEIAKRFGVSRQRIYVILRAE